MKPIRFGWGGGIPNIFVFSGEKEFLIADSEFGGPVTNTTKLIKTVVTKKSRSGLSGEGLIFSEGDPGLIRIPVIASHDPAFYRIVRGGEVPFAVVDRQQKEIEIVWRDYSSILVSYTENGGKILFSFENNQRNSALIVVEKEKGVAVIKKATLLKTRLGVVRILPGEEEVLAIKIFDGVWEIWEKEEFAPSYLIRSDDEEVLRYFNTKAE